MPIKWALLFLTASSLMAKTFAPQGALFPIEEEDVSHHVQKELETAMENHPLEKEIESYILHPDPIPGIGKALKTRSYFVDFSHTFEEDVTVLDKVLFSAGTTVNPLEEIQLSIGLLFLDGSDPAQIEWARKQGEKFMWVLVKGSPLELEEEEDRDIYFDQAGYLTNRLQIQYTPARAEQKGSKMCVEEISIDQKGDEIP